jgi:cAMP-dependent protein kinase regulator
MDPYERSKLSDALIEEKFSKDDFIIKQGEAGDKFYILEEGTAIATKLFTGNSEPTKVMDYKKGQYFGERALLMNDMRAANIVATSDVKCLSLERDTFIRMLGPLESLL